MSFCWISIQKYTPPHCFFYNSSVCLSKKRLSKSISKQILQSDISDLFFNEKLNMELSNQPGKITEKAVWRSAFWMLIQQKRTPSVILSSIFKTYPAGKIAGKAMWRSAFLCLWYCIFKCQFNKNSLQSDILSMSFFAITTWFRENHPSKHMPLKRQQQRPNNVVLTSCAVCDTWK